MSRNMRYLAVVLLLALTEGTQIYADLPEMVPIGDAGNVADTVETGPTGQTVHCGAVAYNYSIGKYEVTAAQYTAFLNAVAATDTYGLYQPAMGDGRPYALIARSGSSGSYTYQLTKDGNYPINYVSWGDAARFCNWLHNGQPAGAQGPGTTETGAYTLNGATDMTGITRNAGATYFIPSADEWHKAAYYKGGGADAGYWLYPTNSSVFPNVVPRQKLPDPGNSGNFRDKDRITISPDFGYTDPVNYLTLVGAFANTPGPYDTYDMGGSMYEWNEWAFAGGYSRVRRGSAWQDVEDSMRSFATGVQRATTEDQFTGFRVASVPEPGSITLLLAGAAGLMWWRRSRR